MTTLSTCPVCGSGHYKTHLEVKDYFLTQEDFIITECTVCRFRFVNPQPTGNELAKYYKSDDYISHHASRKGLFTSVYRLIRNYNFGKKLSYIRRLSKGTNVLDIGCATGDFLAFLKQKGYSVSGIEPDGDARETAVRVNGIEVGDEAEIMAIPDQSKDVISMWHVLEHVPELNQRLDQLQRILKNDGTLFIALPNCDSADAKKYGKFWAGYDVPRHLWHFTQNNCRLLFEKHGFELKETIPMKFDSYYVSLLSEKYLHGSKNIFRATRNGCASNRYAKKNNLNYSSLIYLFNKKVVN
jgi:SAM-dependent methyltransferase